MLAPFDPPDLTTNSLTEAERNELWIFIQMVGGWFGEDDGLIPRRADWKYGTDSEPYGWIDGPEYRRWIVERLARAGIEIGT